MTIKTVEQTTGTEQLTQEQRSALEFELVTSALDGVLTEERYHQILDALLPTLEGFPEAQATLETFGKQEWQMRRDPPSNAPSSAA
jgi:hypothetical protein